MSRLTSALVTSCALTGAGSALAHEGHGLFGPHWHATDVLGFIIAAAIGVAAVAWFGRK
ncbi:MAG: hypothetical protein RJA36_3146 [Pseudomonadota bacterium]